MAAALEWLAASTARRERSGLDYVRLTEPQRQVLADPAPVVLWRDGNQLGKSFAVALNVVWTARGTHPFVRTHQGPVRILVISVSHEQMVGLHEKIWNFLPKHEIDPRNTFDPGRGITGKPPRIVFTSGPGKGSVIQFATYKQGSTRIAGGTYHLVVLDEPPTESMYGEVMPRVMRLRGRIFIAMTPTPDMPDVTWLRDKVASGEVSEHNFGVSEPNMWARGEPFPFRTQSELDAYAEGLLRVEREMRIAGAWEPLVTDAWIDNFDPAQHVRPFQLLDIRGRALVGIGIDHGLQPNKQAVVLMAAQGDRFHDGKVVRNPRAWFLGERVIDGHATAELTADAALELLAEWGLQHTHVDVWVGDRSASSSGRKATRMDNTAIRLALQQRLGLKLRDTPYIRTAKKPPGSVMVGLRMLNTLAARTAGDAPALTVHPSCTQLTEAMRCFRGDKRDPLKDVLDAGRYAFMTLIKPGAWMLEESSRLVF